MTPGGETWRRFRGNRAAWIAFLFLAVVLLGSLAAPLLPLPSPSAIALQDEPVPPARVGPPRARPPPPPPPPPPPGDRPRGGAGPAGASVGGDREAGVPPG